MRLIIIVIALMLNGCMSMPISTMYKLVTLEPLELDPAQIQVAVRTDNLVEIGDDGVVMQLAYKSEDGSLELDEKYPVVVDRTIRPSSILLDGINPNEQVITFSLRTEDTHSMRSFQQQVLAYKEQGGDGTGNFGFAFDQFCFNEIPPQVIETDMFLQIDKQEGFFVFLEDINLLEPDCDNCEMEVVPLCDELEQGEDKLSKR